MMSIFDFIETEIKDNELGLVYKRRGRRLKDNRKIALNGEAGWQPEVLSPNTYYGYWSWLYEIRRISTIVIAPGEIALIVAQDGAPLPKGEMGRIVECHAFQDALAFLLNGGQKGMQLDILTSGEYKINTELFTVITNANADQYEETRNLTLKPCVIETGKVGIVTTQFGAERPVGNIAGPVVKGHRNFQDPQAFLDNGGVKGLQREVLPPGTYELNPWLFKVEQVDAIHIDPGKVGVVTAQFGAELSVGEIAGPIIKGHRNFQDPQAFLDNGGVKGLQEEVLPPGTYELNPWLFKVEQVDAIHIDPGTVGVVISRAGKIPEEHNEFVKPNYRGIWNTPLKAGSHNINTRTTHVEIIPTIQIALDWSDDEEKEFYNYDAKLKTLRLRSRDGFPVKLEVTQLIRIKEEDTPKLIPHIGTSSKPIFYQSPDNPTDVKYNSIRNLVTKVLEPVVRNYFLISAQNYDALDFMVKRDEIQANAFEHILHALAERGVEAVETLLGDADLPDELEDLLTRRTIAEETQGTYQKEVEAELERRKFETEKTQTAQRLQALEEEYKNEQERKRLQIEIDHIQRLIEIFEGVENFVPYVQATQWDGTIPSMLGGDIFQAFAAKVIGVDAGRNKNERLQVMEQFLEILNEKGADVLLGVKSNKKSDTEDTPSLSQGSAHSDDVIEMLDEKESSKNSP